MERHLFFLFLIILVFILAAMLKIIFSINQNDNGDYSSWKTPWEKTVCINLDKNPERWLNIINFCQKIGMNIERFPAIWGKSLDLNNINDVNPIEIQIEWDTTINSLYDPMIKNPGVVKMTDGEIGCALSHIRVWKKYQEMGVNSVLVLEDDALFINSFKEITELLWDLKPENWDIIFFSFTNAGKKLAIHNRYFYKPEYGFELVGYCVSKKGLDKLVSLLPVTAPVDVWLSENFHKLNVWALEPRVINQKQMGNGDINYSSHQAR